MPPTDPNSVATAGADPDFEPAPTGQADATFEPAPAPPAQPLMQRIAQGVASLPGMQEASGFVKGAEKTGAGVLELANKYSPPIGRNPAATSAAIQNTADWLRRNTETHGWEQVGDIGETVAELMEGGPAVEEAGAKALSFGDHLMNAAKQAKILEAHPVIARMVRVGLDATKAAARGGAEMGGQTFVKTGGDPDAALDAAEGGAAIGGVLGGVGSAAREAGQAATDYAGKVRPQIRTIDDVDTPILASQNRNASPAAIDAADIRENPDYRAKQQAAAAQITEKGAQTAVRKSLTELNAGRVTPTVTDPARMLAAPEDAKPYQFTMDLAGGDPEATREGTSAFDPRKQHIGTRVVEGKGPGTFDLNQYSPELADAAAERAAQDGTLGANVSPEPQGSHREPIFQYLNSVKPSQEGSGVIEGLQGGRGTMTFSGPEQAVSGLSQLENVMRSSRFADMEPAIQTRIQNAAKGLQNQLDDFNAYRIKNPHFAPVDIDAAAQHTGDFSQGADQLEQAVQPVYNKLDEVSGGQWGKLRKIEQNMRRIINSPTTPEAYASAMAKLEDTRTQMQNILDTNKEQISEPEWRQANRVYRDASTMRDIHDALEKSYNGVDADTAAATASDPGGGIPRIMTGSDAGFKRLQALRQSRPQDIERVLGTKGYTNLYRMTDLLKDPEEAPVAKNMMKQIGTVLRRHGRALGGLSASGVAGGLLGHGLGGGVGAATGVAAGTMSGVIAEAYTRKVIHDIATNPALTDRFIYAVRNRASVRVAAPLIASMILRDTQQKKTPPAGGPQ
jgi:hypothetical protein